MEKTIYVTVRVDFDSDKELSYNEIEHLMLEHFDNHFCIGDDFEMETTMCGVDYDGDDEE